MPVLQRTGLRPCWIENAHHAGLVRGVEWAEIEMRRPGYSKYGVRTDQAGIEARTEDNIRFHSRRECERYKVLRANLRAGIISNLKLQPRFPLFVGEQKICEYVADFSYQDLSGKPVIEDVKGARTAIFIIKSKLFSACYPGLRIVEVQ